MGFSTWVLKGHDSVSRRCGLCPGTWVPGGSIPREPGSRCVIFDDLALEVTGIQGWEVAAIPRGGDVRGMTLQLYLGIIICHAV